MDDLVHVLILVLSLGVILLHERETSLLRLAPVELVQPVRTGLTVALMGILILPLVEALQVQLWWVTAVMLVGVLLYTVLIIGDDLKMKLTSGALPWLLGGCAILIIPGIRMPGILGASSLLLVAYWRSDKLLLGLAAAFLLFYLGAYYYTLEWTLLEKSIALMVTGALLFGLRVVIQRFSRGGVT